MRTINATVDSIRLKSLLETSAEYGELLTIWTEKGTVVVIPEDVYCGITETSYIESISGLKEKILAASEEQDEECVPIGDVEW
jgi:PHD/YefM family antitoxin component YafN of YafNO toxin-antitoxin module